MQASASQGGQGPQLMTEGLFLQGSLDTQALSLGPGLARRSVLKRPVIEEIPTGVLPGEAETACLALRGGLWARLCPILTKQKHEAGLWRKAALPLGTKSPQVPSDPHVGATGIRTDARRLGQSASKHVHEIHSSRQTRSKACFFWNKHAVFQACQNSNESVGYSWLSN